MENKEGLKVELAKVKKDRDLVMKKKDELVGILSEAANTLKTSILVCSQILFYHSTLNSVLEYWIDVCLNQVLQATLQMLCKIDCYYVYNI